VTSKSAGAGRAGGSSTDVECLDDFVSGMLGVAEAHLGLRLAITLDCVQARDSIEQLPLRMSDGSVLGHLVCTPATESANDPPTVALSLLAGLIVDCVEQRARELESWRAKIAATGICALLAALEARDGYTKAHSEAVVELSAATGRKLGLSEPHLDEVKQVALLHDLGKIAVPEPLLRKPNALAPQEWAQVRRHSEVGARIVSSIDELSHLAPAIRAGHERWDGLGYPDGLSGEGIPLTSRIVSLCDAYDAMVSDRPYSAALSRRDAMSEVAVGSGTQFCPTCVRALRRIA
jgi:HD-GYP domain-containing protein (c-di-GMP phosphodiesterase class II)